MAVNLASKFSNKVDEAFYGEAQASLVTNNDYDFTGVQEVNVYSFTPVALGNYNRTGAGDRYGTAAEMQDNKQTLSISNDKSATWIIDRGNQIQSVYARAAAASVARYTREVLIPAYDTCVFAALANGANAANKTTSAITKTNAYEAFLNGQTALGNAYVPATGRVCLASYAYLGLLKQDPAFVKYGDTSQEMLRKGVLGMVDGVKIVAVAAAKLPTGCKFILTHPSVCVAPKQLQDVKIHDNPPGISGWKVEVRMIYDAFVLNAKKGGIWYHGSAA